MTKVQVLKTVFGASNQELLAFRKTDPKGFDQLAEEAAESIGQTITAN